MHDDLEAGSAPLSDLKNLGPVSKRWLQSIGIRNREQLEFVGVVRAYQLIKSQFPEASLNLLWALEGALTAQSWKTLGEDTKIRLSRELDDMHLGGITKFQEPN